MIYEKQSRNSYWLFTRILNKYVK